MPPVSHQPEGGRTRPQPRRRGVRVPARPVVEPRRRGAGDRPGAPDRPDAPRVRLPAARGWYGRGQDRRAAAHEARSRGRDPAGRHGVAPPVEQGGSGGVTELTSMPNAKWQMPKEISAGRLGSLLAFSIWHLTFVFTP